MKDRPSVVDNLNQGFRNSRTDRAHPFAICCVAERNGYFQPHGKNLLGFHAGDRKQY
jgi:hypothetical protein